MPARVEARTGSFDPNQFDADIVDEGVERPHGV
jgi:hypothetical protein